MAWPFEIPSETGGRSGSSSDLSRITDLFRTLGNPARTPGVGGQGTSRGMTTDDWWQALAPGQALQYGPGSPATPTHPSVSTQYATPFGTFGVGAGQGQPATGQPAPPSPLPSTRPTMPQIGGLPEGKDFWARQDTGGGDEGKVNWGSLAGIAAPFLIALLGSNPYKGLTTDAAGQLSTLAKQLGGEGKALAGQGLQTLGPVLQYLTALAGGDPQALANATQPERARVLDQYDSARKALQFLPRGGGQAGAVMQAGSKAAGDIGSLTADARRSAVGTLGTLGKGLLEEGLTEERYATDALTQVINAYLGLSQAQSSQLSGLGRAVGTALPYVFAALA
jgi:hypothetical protein